MRLKLSAAKKRERKTKGIGSGRSAASCAVGPPNERDRKRAQRGQLRSRATRLRNEPAETARAEKRLFLLWSLALHLRLALGLSLVDLQLRGGLVLKRRGVHVPDRPREEADNVRQDVATQGPSKRDGEALFAPTMQETDGRGQVDDDHHRIFGACLPDKIHLPF